MKETSERLEGKQVKKENKRKKEK